MIQVPLPRTTIALASLLLSSVLAVVSTAVESNSTAEDTRSGTVPSVDFGRQVQPVLAKRCYACHGPDAAEGGLRLDSRDAAVAELESGEHAVVPGEDAASAILQRVTTDDESMRMPPEGAPLKEAEVAAIRQWIVEGAKWQPHWAFQPLSRPDVPKPKDQAWVRNPIDAFVRNRLETHEMRPAKPADRVALIRRATYDLTGLPPTLEEVAAFLLDQREDAYERLIDRLLASPQHGEKWARYWLDLVRFAETNSFERDGLKPHAWRYRDYVIRSFNSDKPYDQFIREQLAGDEHASPTADQMIATGYYRLGLWDDEPSDPAQLKYDVLDDIVKTTGQVFLGLTIDCARCHEHKIDPLRQQDYYGLLAFFHNITPMQTSGSNIERPIFPSAEAREEYAASEAGRQAEIDTLAKKVQELETVFLTRLEENEPTGGADESPDSREKRRNRRRGELQKLLQEKGPKTLGEAVYVDYQQARERLQKLRGDKTPAELALCVTESGRNAPATFVLLRGNPHVPGPQVEPSFPAILGAQPPVIEPLPEDVDSSGRRTALAEWIASAENPLTARVMANRVWQFHFGRGIVRSPNNFGVQGDPPTHPELLDWLANQMIDGNWQLKQLHRLIMTSNTYRMSSQGDAAYAAVDPTNNYLWRFDIRRLTAEEIRDSILAVNGRLNSQMYGPGFYSDIPQEVLAGQSRPGAGWGNSPDTERARRSIYIHVKRSLLTPMLESFDLAEPDSSCPVRFSTTQPTQALGMLNSQFIHQQAEVFAERLRREAGDDVSAQVRLGLRLVTCREPAAEEVRRGVALIENFQTHDQLDRQRSLQLYALTLLNLNEFFYLD
ncbi:MAG: PSD1 and planctomycete cytochrome C domain-containing protein [Pirellulaceae bacterium]